MGVIRSIVRLIYIAPRQYSNGLGGKTLTVCVGVPHSQHLREASTPAVLFGKRLLLHGLGGLVVPTHY